MSLTTTATPALESGRPGLAQACDVEVALDTPGDGAEVAAGQRLAGWAVDRAARTGSGVDAVRVAFDVTPDQADDRAFLALPSGQPRGDVAAALGSQRYLGAGFAQEFAVFSLAPGQHQVVVQAHSACGWTGVVRGFTWRGETGGTGSIVDALGPARTSEAQASPPAIEPPTVLTGSVSTSALDRAPALPYYPHAQAPRFSLTVSPLGPTGVALSWDAAPGSNAYNVYMGEDGAPPPPPVPGGPPRALGLSGLQRVQSGVLGTTTSVGGLNAGSTYSFVVRALTDSGGEAGSSDTARITVAPLPPNALSATAGAGWIALSWSDVPGAVTYTVLGAAGNAPLVPDPHRSNLTQTAVNVDRVGLGSYRFQVEARDAAGGRLVRSNVAQVVIDPATLAGAGPPPAGPAGWSASQQGGPTLPTGADGLSTNTSAGGARLPSASLPGPGVGGGPAPIAGVGQAANAQASAAAQLGVDRAGANAAKLTWTPVRGAATYAIYQAQGATPLAFLLATSNTNTTLSGLAPGIGYSFQVRARDNVEAELSVSNTVTFTPTP
jgi:hypothetical protein